MDTDGTSPAAPNTAEAAAPAPPKKPTELHPTEPRRGTKPLPTNRIAFSKQLDLLRAFAAAGGIERKSVSLSTAAEMVGMTPATASLANGFFVDAQLLTKVDGPQPQFQPSKEVLEFQQAHAWAPEIAGAKLAPALETHWAWKALDPRLKFSATLSETDTIRYLAEACGATPDYRPQLIIIVQFLEVAGLLIRDGQIIRRIENRTIAGTGSGAPDPVANTNGNGSDRSVGGKPAAGVPVIGGGGGGRAEGQIRFAVSMNFDVTELRGWSPDRIARLFEGISKVIAAKGGDDPEEAEG